jgi:hypothetical protein
MLLESPRLLKLILSGTLLQTNTFVVTEKGNWSWNQSNSNPLSGVSWIHRLIRCQLKEIVVRPQCRGRVDLRTHIWRYQVCAADGYRRADWVQENISIWYGIKRDKISLRSAGLSVLGVEVVCFTILTSRHWCSLLCICCVWSRCVDVGEK